MASSNGQTSAKRDRRGQRASMGVFISHKAEDHAAAETLQRILEVHSADKVKAYISEDIPGGAEWRKWINDNLLRSNLLILLFTDPRVSWDWCVFEAGLFLGPEGNQSRRIVCLHHPKTDPPEPLRNWQTVPAEPNRLQSFLGDFFGNPEYTGVPEAINEALANEEGEIEKLATEIENLFRPFSFNPWSAHMRMALEFEPDQIEVLKCSQEIPRDVAIADADSRVLAEVFGLGDGTYKWQQLHDRIAERGYTDWIKELAQVMVRAIGKNIREIEITNTFRAADGGRIFRPVLYQVDFLDDVPQCFHVLFTEQSTPGNVAGRGPLANVFQMLRIGHRFRWEVLKSYMGDMEKLAANFGAEVACRRLREAMEVVEDETARLRLLDETVLTAPFDDPEHKVGLTRLLERWRNEIRDALFRALKDENIAAVEKHLITLRHANAEFLAICGERYAQLAQQELEEEKNRAVPPQAE